MKRDLVEEGIYVFGVDLFDKVGEELESPCVDRLLIPLPCVVLRAEAAWRDHLGQSFSGLVRCC